MLSMQLIKWQARTGGYGKIFEEGGGGDSTPLLFQI